MKEIDVNKEGVLEQLASNIEKSGNFLQIKITQATIPPEIIEGFGKKVIKGGLIRFGDLLSEIKALANENKEYAPIINFKGAGVSPMDRLIFLALTLLTVEEEFEEASLDVSDCLGGDE